MRAVVILAAGEVVALASPGLRLTPRDDILRPRSNEVLDADGQAVADALHDVERGRDLVVLDLGEIRDGNAGRLADFGQGAVERAPDFLQSRANLIRLDVHGCQSPAPRETFPIGNIC